jgi:hypothetical protein
VWLRGNIDPLDGRLTRTIGRYPGYHVRYESDGKASEAQALLQGELVLDLGRQFQPTLLHMRAHRGLGGLGVAGPDGAHDRPVLG